MKTRFKKSWKSWVWDQYIPEDMKWHFGNMGALNLETKKLWNQETSKPIHFETKKQQTKKPNNKKPTNQVNKELLYQETQDWIHKQLMSELHCVQAGPENMLLR